MGIFTNDFRELEARVRELEVQVAQLTRALTALTDPAEPSPSPSPRSWTNPAPQVPVWNSQSPPDQGQADWSGRAHRLKNDERAIEAIKVVRGSTGWSLKQAKHYVDQL